MSTGPGGASLPPGFTGDGTLPGAVAEALLTAFAGPDALRCDGSDADAERTAAEHGLRLGAVNPR
ncbi:hypothetical protein GTW66_30080 [Streptomyces sp. SID5473]|uniref:hypothetical protein n=1 Tax=Streptomyces sp. SID5473 TaxID=2690299 RepID=UPI00025CCF2D|nr:hypothetical protein [Streptomyces sp. SID5473]EIF94143.1 hypothetical protein [Streptomyces tsukubensis NRRL18488]MYS68085.1 hypothetical protein [Streptomyces sp. SID5473]